MNMCHHLLQNASNIHRSMNYKKMTAGILPFIGTGTLVAFYWLEFFPSKYTTKLLLMLLLWLVQLLSLLWWIKTMTTTTEGGIGTLYWVLGATFALVSLLYCMGSAAPNQDRELVKEFISNGKRVELYHLSRHDHTALEVFYGADGWLAQRYFQDHFTIKGIERKGDLISIQNSLQAEVLTLEVEKMGIQVVSK